MSRNAPQCLEANLRGLGVFVPASSRKHNNKALRDVHAKLGEATMERDFLLDVERI